MALGALVVVPDSAGAAAACDDGPCLLVKVVGDRGGAPLSVQSFSADDLSALSGFADHGPFLIRSQPGGGLSEAPSDRVPALKLTDLIAAMGLPTTGDGRPTYAQVIGVNGVSHDLERNQLGTPPGNGFAGGFSPSVWFDHDPISPSVHFFRPLQAGSGPEGTDPRDTNADYHVTAGAADPPLVIVLHKTGALLHPTITGPAKVRGATAATFAVTLPTQAGLEYQWSVDHVPTTPKPATAPTLTHTWPDVSTTTSSLITVDVTAADNSSGAASFVVSVCPKKGNTRRCTPPKPGDGPTAPGGGHTEGPNPPTGPDDSDGNQPGGQSNGSQDPQSPSDQTGPDTQGTGHHQQPGTGHTPTTKGEPGPRSGKEQSVAAAGRRVSGQLLAASAAFVVPEQQPTVTAAAAAARPTEPHWAWPWKFAGLLVVPLLIGLGMAGESLQLRRRLARMRP